MTQLVGVVYLPDNTTLSSLCVYVVLSRPPIPRTTPSPMSLSKFASPTRSSYPRECLEEITDDTRHMTETVLYEFVDEKSEDDRELTLSQKTTLHNSASQCIRKATSHAVSDQQVRSSRHDLWPCTACVVEKVTYCNWTMLHNGIVCTLMPLTFAAALLFVECQR